MDEMNEMAVNTSVITVWLGLLKFSFSVIHIDLSAAKKSV